MQAVTVVEGIAAVLLRDNIDTDVIIPSKDITSPDREGYAAKLFTPWRYLQPGGAENPGFVLNQPPWREARVLLAGRNFGCGSSREMAVWALWQFGLRCVIAPSFGAIFRDNALRNGLLPVVLPTADLERLAATLDAQACALRVDLQTCTIHGPGGLVVPFDFDAHERETLLSGLDAIDQTWRRRADIEAFEAADRLRRPWVWADAPPAAATPTPLPEPP
jgi:3-isopropylmalate/(R)-2-methylmalate dehydratase small subunit